MSKNFDTEKWNIRYEEAVNGLIALFDKGIPLGVLDKDFEADHSFLNYNERWKSSIESYMEMYEDCLSSIDIRELMEKHLKELPETASVYWIHCRCYEFEAWVLGDIEMARDCVRGKVTMELITEPYCWDMTEEEVETINDGYAIEKIAVGENFTYTAKKISHIPIDDDIWEHIVFNPHLEINN